MSKNKESLEFRLDGLVSIVETDKNGNETVTLLDGEIVLRCLIVCAEEGLILLKKKLKEDKNNEG